VKRKDHHGQVVQLLRLEKRRQSARSGKRVMFTVLLPLLNLFFCAYYERHMAGARDLPALRLFLTVQCCAIGLLAAVHFLSSLRDIIRKIRLLPVRSISRTIFVTLALFRDPLALGLLSTSAFGLAIMLRPALAVLPALLGTVFLLGAATQALVGSALLVASERSERAAGITVICLFSVLASLLWSVTFAANGFPIALPPVVWASGVMGHLTSGDITAAFLTCLPLLAVPFLVPWAAARWMEQQ
jgi:hypothetical protein